MNSKSLRRLATDHGSLHTAGLPPNYLFPHPSASDPSSDLTALDVLLVGPVGTPYSKGVWRLHLDIPPTYPTAPPTATFRTRLWHPNIDEATGAVCVETLKRDWSSTLKLRDVLVTISCLLIQPNPASALNEAAGKLASEDWDGFCRRAKLMTEIHAGIPKNIAEEVREAQMRGEDKGEIAAEKEPISEVDGHGKHLAKVTPAAGSKVQQSRVQEDEENLRRRGDTVEPESDPESDWIPGPLKSPKPFVAAKDNIFGIKGLGDTMRFNTPPKRIFATGPKVTQQDGESDNDDSDPFITVQSRSNAQQTFSLRMPPTVPSRIAEDASKDTPELLKFSHQNPFSAIQLNNQTHPLLKEFCWSWQDSEILHDTETIKEGPSKTDVRKRMAGDDFEKQRHWETKKFKRTGYDLSKYNKGDFGPRTGIARL
ncbi:ubiquitin-conjugating enzyme/RWD-like protein [Massariosphaeria phaeospora]|uniref:Ubiquitin-conjugating enzyme/RWD-like protein n=1 Tax=Massariosphaeria phaeospora TaxID=100035 RepID=A0A7C8M2K8_9PLEO|nr:ubiquitin-conjugating enzyme/RWD-like protein [Massariosphaeria phaeospora]